MNSVIWDAFIEDKLEATVSRGKGIKKTVERFTELKENLRKSGALFSYHRFTGWFVVPKKNMWLYPEKSVKHICNLNDVCDIYKRKDMSLGYGFYIKDGMACSSCHNLAPISVQRQLSCD